MIHLNKKLLGVDRSCDFPAGILGMLEFFKFCTWAPKCIHYICPCTASPILRHWFKGSDTTILVKFLEWRYARLLAEGLEDQSFVEQVWAALSAANGFLTLLYSCSFWLSKDEARKASDFGLSFLKAFSRSAAVCFHPQLPRFKINPKFHMCAHLVETLAEDARMYSHARNPLMNSCQLDEDFVGRIASIARQQHAP